jgi:DNA repair photolyase
MGHARHNRRGMPRARIDDRLHPQLRRATAPAQAEIDALRQEARTAYGPTMALDVEARSALNDFTMGGHATGIAWSLNPYVGCAHRCAYCFVPDTMKVERPRWGNYVIVKRNLPHVLRREMARRAPLPVYLSTATDPYQAIEGEREVTRRCLEVLARRDWPLDVLTRSPLVLRDVDQMRRFRRLRVGLSVPTLDDEARKALEPAAPAIAARLRTLGRLADEGFQVYANYSPAYPLTGSVTARDVAVAFRDAGVQWVNTSHWRRQDGYLAKLWARFHGTPWEGLVQHIGDEGRQEALRRDLEVALRAVGIPLRTGFFNPPFTAEPPRTRDARLDSAEATAPRFAHGLLEPGLLAPTVDGVYPELGPG